MQQKISYKRLVIVVSFVGLAITSVATASLFSQRFAAKELLATLDQTTEGTINGTSTAISPTPFIEAVIGLPVRLHIPKIKVDAQFEYVGVTQDGAMDVPKGPKNVAWYNLGPRPGEIGSAVVTGHYGWKNGIPAVFDHLTSLQKGDKIFVTDESGATSTFIVRDIQSFGENDDASLVFESNDAQAHLNLITCQGVWNKMKKSYSKRLVVFSDREVTK